ncbi:hypothetical protein NCG89_11820 [Spongiibacter taiwanensis]|uniref:hypothetical protein n=1 Tax=Spongiibacter taiwanensis TaxID=1748242 RepID=UPI00203546D1|nr:hypothetical protein [Spongiibacter taiwanensis]USA42209.1 hypothetical protein NCG89_11820 [Spongiibacter taiwanensis]
MSRMSEAELRFLRRRGALVSAWPWVGSACLLGLIALAAVLFWRVPQLVNPWFVFDQINADALPESQMILMAAMLPVVLLLLGVLVLTLFACLSNERRLLAMLALTQAP